MADLKDRYNESRSRWEEAIYDKELTKSAYEGAKNLYEFHEKEASGAWGQDIPPGNTAEYRHSLKTERDQRFEEYQDASVKEQIAKEEYDYAKRNWEESYEYEEDNDYSY